MLRAVKDGVRSLLSKIQLKVQAGNCIINGKGYLRHQGKLWVPRALILSEADDDVAESGLDLLRTKLI